MAANRGSAPAGVNPEFLSKLKEMAGGRCFAAAARPMAGVMTSADAASAIAARPDVKATLLNTKKQTPVESRIYAFQTDSSMTQFDSRARCGTEST